MQEPQAHYFVYILGGPERSSVKVGIAGDLQQQVQHINQEGASEAAALQEQPRLVYYEHYAEEEVARNREREIIESGHESTYRLIDSMNPNWLDLSDTLA